MSATTIPTDDGPVDGSPDLAPMCGQAEWDELLEGLVVDFAPRLFAVFQEWGDRADGQIVAWGMQFEDYVEVIGHDRGMRMTLLSTKEACWYFSRAEHTSAYVIWLSPGTEPPLVDKECALAPHPMLVEDDTSS